MDAFELFQKFSFSMKEKMVADETIRKLLYNMTPDALNLPAPAKEDVADKITLNYYIGDDGAIADSALNGFIALYPTYIETSENQINFRFAITIVISKDFYELDNDKLRLMMLLSRVYKLFQKTKLEFSSKIELFSILPVIIELGQRVGFKIEGDVIENERINSL